MTDSPHKRKRALRVLETELPKLTGCGLRTHNVPCCTAHWKSALSEAISEDPLRVLFLLRRPVNLRVCGPRHFTG